MMAKDQILQRIRESVRTTAPGATVILYGSYARGDNGPGSDIDLLVLVDAEKVTRDERIKITYPLYSIEFDTGIIISPMVFSKKKWETHHAPGNFHHNVMKDGIIL